ncbi:hypothetical protein H0H87_004903 [Tephrocybe sp. NHM501043]|nr:hypothetical protein H0H87_004903 [Tephrocybe sp. NHM501043]
MKKIINGFGKVGRKFDSFLSSRSRPSSPAREDAQVTSGSSPVTRTLTPPPDVVSTHGNLPQVAEVPSITVDLAETGSVTSLTSSEIGSLAVQASADMRATGRLQAYGSPGARNTKMKSGLITAWSGTQMLLSRVEGLLDGTPFKTPVAAVNILIKLGNDVAENNDSLKDIISSTEEGLNTDYSISQGG